MSNLSKVYTMCRMTIDSYVYIMYVQYDTSGIGLRPESIHRHNRCIYVRCREIQIKRRTLVSYETMK